LNPTSPVCDEGQRHHAGGHSRDRAAARAARRQLQVEGISGGAEQRVRGVALEREFRHVGLADHDRAGRAGAGERELVPAVAPRAACRAAPGGGQVGAGDVVLDRQWNAIERRQGSAPRKALVAGPGIVQRLLAPKGDDCIDLRIERLDTRQA